MKKIVLLLGLLVLVGAGCANSSDNNVAADDVTLPTDNQQEQEETMVPTSQSWKFPGVLSDETIQNKQVRLTTEKGDIVFETYADTAPMAVSNFIYLANSTYFNGLTFHRREEGFVIQGGDPNGNGTGGPGYRFDDELDDEYTYERGIVAMANSGPNTNGSQFFIMLGDTALPKAYSIFGKVIEGMDVVDAIAVGDKMTTVTVEDVE